MILPIVFNLQMNVASIIIFLCSILSTAGEEPHNAAENGGGGVDPKELSVRHNSDFLFAFSQFITYIHISYDTGS